MGANAINATIIHHNDTVCILYGGDTLCDDQFGRTRDLLIGKALRILASVAVSTALVLSSKINTLGCFNKALAIQSL